MEEKLSIDEELEKRTKEMKRDKIWLAVIIAGCLFATILEIFIPSDTLVCRVLVFCSWITPVLYSLFIFYNYNKIKKLKEKKAEEPDNNKRKYHGRKRDSA